jgi:hypothetical protein
MIFYASFLIIIFVITVTWINSLMPKNLTQEDMLGFIMSNWDMKQIFFLRNVSLIVIQAFVLGILLFVFA